MGTGCCRRITSYRCHCTTPKSYEAEGSRGKKGKRGKKQQDRPGINFLHDDPVAQLFVGTSWYLLVCSWVVLLDNAVSGAGEAIALDLGSVWLRGAYRPAAHSASSTLARGRDWDAQPREPYIVSLGLARPLASEARRG